MSLSELPEDGPLSEHDNKSKRTCPHVKSLMPTFTCDEKLAVSSTEHRFPREAFAGGWREHANTRRILTSGAELPFACFRKYCYSFARA